jgi:hypothetical protein
MVPDDDYGLNDFWYRGGSDVGTIFWKLGCGQCLVALTKHGLKQ